MPYSIIKDQRRNRLHKFAVQNTVTKRLHGWTSLPKAKRQQGLLKRITGGGRHHHLGLVHQLRGGVGEELDENGVPMNEIIALYNRLADMDAVFWMWNAVDLGLQNQVVHVDPDVIRNHFLNNDVMTFFNIVADADRLHELMLQFVIPEPQRSIYMNWLAILIPRLNAINNFMVQDGIVQQPGEDDFEDDFASTYHGGDPSEAGNDSQADMLDFEMDPAGNDSDATVPIGGSGRKMSGGNREALMHQIRNPGHQNVINQIFVRGRSRAAREARRIVERDLQERQQIALRDVAQMIQRRDANIREMERNREADNAAADMIRSGLPSYYHMFTGEKHQRNRAETSANLPEELVYYK
jgi:hypothetical protein